jgi:hypothetical protein
VVNEIVTSIKNLLGTLKPWVIIAPWEQCLRVRFGKHVKLLREGFHFRLLMFDRMYIQSIRLRFTAIDRQTLTTKDSKIITLTGQIGYSITDIELLYRTLHHAEDTIRNMVKSEIANYVYNHTFLDCEPQKISEHMLSVINFKGYGLSITNLDIIDFALTKAYRIIGDYGGGNVGAVLTTEGTTISQ